MYKEIYERYEKFEKRGREIVIEMRQWAKKLKQTEDNFPELGNFSIEVNEEADKLEEMFKSIK